MNTKSQERFGDQKEKHPSPRIARRRAMTRERILKAAGQLIAKHGIDAVTITDIANAADVSRGNLYSHFESKETLLNAIVEPMVREAVEQTQALENLPPAQAIARLLRVHARLWREIPGALSVAHQIHGELAEASTPMHESPPRNPTRIFQQAADAGILRVTPALAIKIFNDITVPLLELCDEAPDPDTLFVESMLRLLLKEKHAEAQESQATQSSRREDALDDALDHAGTDRKRYRPPETVV